MRQSRRFLRWACQMDLSTWLTLRAALQIYLINHSDSDDLAVAEHCWQSGRPARQQIKEHYGFPTQLRALNRLDTHDVNSDWVPKAGYHFRSGAWLLLDPPEWHLEYVSNPALIICGLTLVTADCKLEWELWESLPSLEVPWDSALRHF